MSSGCGNKIEVGKEGSAVEKETATYLYLNCRILRGLFVALNMRLQVAPKRRHLCQSTLARRFTRTQTHAMQYIGHWIRIPVEVWMSVCGALCR
jgi:hypothetical protein